MARKIESNIIGEDPGIVNLADADAKVGFTATHPCPEEVYREPVALQGYAYSGGGRQISRVDVSLDGGKTWDQAELLSTPSTDDGSWKGNNSWAWKRWRYTGRLPTLPLPRDQRCQQ